ncbi:MAG: hypothetical protein ABIS68_03755, partial [Casimicrobiaceae bacterium]
MTSQWRKVFPRDRLAQPAQGLGARLTLYCVCCAGLLYPGAAASADAAGRQDRKVSQAGILYIVDSTGDGAQVGPTSICNDGTGACTLRAAIQAVNAHAGDDGIEFSLPAGSVIDLSSALPSLSSNVDIVGPGAYKLQVKRKLNAPSFRIFDVTSTGTVTLSGMQISDGKSVGTGAGIQNNSGGTLNIIECILYYNIGAGNGGAMYNSGTGTVNIIRSMVRANRSASGAGIYNNGTGSVNVINSVITENLATGTG